MMFKVIGSYTDRRECDVTPSLVERVVATFETEEDAQKCIKDSTIERRKFNGPKYKRKSPLAGFDNARVEAESTDSL